MKKTKPKTKTAKPIQKQAKTTKTKQKLAKTINNHKKSFKTTSQNLTFSKFFEVVGPGVPPGAPGHHWPPPWGPKNS